MVRVRRVSSRGNDERDVEEGGLRIFASGTSAATVAACAPAFPPRAAEGAVDARFRS